MYKFYTVTHADGYEVGTTCMNFRELVAYCREFWADVSLHDDDREDNEYGDAEIVERYFSLHAEHGLFESLSVFQYSFEELYPFLEH